MVYICKLVVGTEKHYYGILDMLMVYLFINTHHIYFTCYLVRLYVAIPISIYIQFVFVTDTIRNEFVSGRHYPDQVISVHFRADFTLIATSVPPSQRR